MKKNSIYQSLSFGALSLAFIFLLNAAVVQAEPIPVDPGATADIYTSTCGNNKNTAETSLRNAICYANAQSGDDEITLPAGIYTLSRTGSGEDNNLTGDLDIKSNVKITGAGASSTIIDAGDLDRIFHIVSGTVTLEKLTIRNGTADLGGGIRNAGTSLTINDCVITGNIATNKGGGIHNTGGSLTITNSSIESNQTSGSDTYGGGISHYASTVTLTNSSVKNNTAQNSGGGIYVYGNATQLNVNQCTISGNAAQGSGTGYGLGGGIYQTTGTATLTNSTLSGNTARLGGGVYLTNNTLNLRHVTVTNNTGTVDAGGIRVFSGSATATNTILADNIDGTGVNAPNLMGVLTSGGYNLVGVIDPSAATFTRIAGDLPAGSAAALEALADNGGGTYTHALQSGSAAIDAIPNGTSDCGSGYAAIDQRGITRPQETGCDIGAFESGLVATPTPDPNATPTATPVVTPTLTITVQPARITEGRSATVIVKLSSAVENVSVTLTSGSSTDLKVGGHINSSQTVQTNADGVATFTIYAEDDGDVVGLEPVTLTATATGYDDATATVFIRDSGAMSGDTLTFPSFVLHASYDWLHNFYDNNTDANPASPYITRKYASDNFNKLILIDSNLFPIYTALQGDAEMPNVTMRNWTSGPGIYSPSVNDYMNRSVAAAADYINVTSKIPFGYGATDSLDAVGMRSYLQWVYALDPANHNFRRYKFIKIQDSVPDVPYWDSSMNTGFIDKSKDSGFAGTDDNQGTKCDTCDPDYWYVVNYDQSVNAYDNKCPDSCYDDNNDGVYPDNKFLMYAKIQTEGMVDPDRGIDPPVRFQVPVSAQTIDTQSTVDVSMELKGFKTANDATMSFILNADSVESTCQQTTTANTENSDYGLAAGGCGDGHGACRQVVTVSFDDVPTSCASNCNSQYCYMTIDMKPLDKNHGGWFIELPNYEPPKEKDNAFRIPVVGFDNITGAEWDMLTPDEQKKKIEQRWANIDGYLDVMPPKSYPGYVNYTARVGYGYQTNTTFSSADNVRFKDPRDIAVYRDYFDQANGGPVYIFVADTMNSRIQVFMNATGVAGDPGAAFPIRPVRVKGPNDNSTKTTHKSNELGMRIYSSNGDSVRFGDGRKADWRQYTTLPGTSFVNLSAGKGEFYYPHSIAVDQDPDTKDVYLFVADTFNHRIQVFRDVSGVSSQAITAKKFDFKFEAGWGTYPLQTSEFMTAPGAYNFRYPKGLSVARFKENSSLLYVVDSKNYRLMKYEIGENDDGGIKGIVAANGYGYNGSKFVKNLLDNAGKPITTYNNNTAGFWNPQDVATGYSGFFIYTSPHGKGTKFLNNYMVYVTDYARNMTSITRDRLNMRVMQFIEIPGVYKSISGSWIPWATQAYSNFTTGFPGQGALGQSVYGLSDGVYRSSGSSAAATKSAGSSGNVPGVAGYFTDRPVGITALHWNTLKPIDIRITVADPAQAETNPDGTPKDYLPGEPLPLSRALRIGVSSRKLSFGYPESHRTMFMGYTSDWTELTGRWDATDAGRVHLFCYDKAGKYIQNSHVWTTTTKRGMLFEAPFTVTLSNLGCTSPGFVKIVVEDKDFGSDARTGTAFYGVK